MRAGEFSESEGDGPADEGGESKAENDGRARKLDGWSGAEQEAGADRASDGNHGHLSGAELVAKAGFGVGSGRRHGVSF